LGPEAGQYDNVQRKYDGYFEYRSGVPIEADPETGKQSVKSFPRINEKSEFQDRSKVIY